MKHAKCYKKGYPRPQFVRDNYELLNGKWDFCLDKDNIGEDKKWYLKTDFKSVINVPYPYQAKGSGIGSEEFCQVVWYSRKVKVATKDRANLIFEGSDYSTKVWVNGNYVGSNEGGYHRFSFDITDYLVDSCASIVVRVEDNFDATQPRGKQRWKEDNFACWYTEVTGIWKSVWIEYVNREHIERVDYLTDFEKYTLTCDYYINANNVTDGDITLRTIIEYDNRVVVDSSQLVTSDYYSATFDLRSKADPFKIINWSCHSPNVYDISFELTKGGSVIDRVGSYFGFANYACVNDYITNNSSPMYLKMILDQGYYENGLLTATEEELIKDIELVKEVGLNGIRKHQKIESDIFYYYCDIMGVYCWLEMPSSYDYSNKGVQRITEQWTKIVRDHSNHPSIMAYVPFNESWGVPQILFSNAQQNFTKGIYHLTKTLSSNKLVISNDGWEHTTSDVLTLHNYGATGESLKNVFDDMDNLIGNKLVTSHPTKLTYAQGFKYEGQPILVSEFAGIAFAKDNKEGNWGYGAMVEGEDTYLARFESLINYIHSIPNCSGYCITQMTDVMQEVNGLWTIGRKYKVDKEKLATIIRR